MQELNYGFIKLKGFSTGLTPRLNPEPNARLNTEPNAKPNIRPNIRLNTKPNIRLNTTLNTIGTLTKSKILLLNRVTICRVALLIQPRIKIRF